MLEFLTLFNSNAGIVCKDKLVHIHEAISGRAVNDHAHMATVLQQSEEVSIINANVKDLRDASHSVQERFRDTLANVIPKIEHISEMSAAQSDNICVLLRAIQDQVSGLSTQISKPGRIPHRQPRRSSDHGLIDNSDDSEEDCELLESIERLCQLAKQKGGTFSDSDAEIVIEDFDALLKSALLQPLLTKSAFRGSRKRPISMVQEENSDDDGSRDLKRIRSLLTSSDFLFVNQKGNESKLFCESP